MSQRDSGYQRQERDLYETPEWVTEALIPNLRLVRRVWEPAAGSGQMLRVLSRNFMAYGSDLATGTDFFRYPPLDDVDAIITNPPYETGAEFIERALRLMEPVGGVVAMLMRTDFDHAKSRAHLFRDCPAFAKKLVLMKRIAWFVEANGKPKASPSFNHAWYIWDWKHEGPPTIGYGP
ncbi:MAG: hypothetical protein WC807_18665 [Hyphomicrobium sp.]|jgi:hypothetical protein